MLRCSPQHLSIAAPHTCTWACLLHTRPCAGTAGQRGSEGKWSVLKILNTEKWETSESRFSNTLILVRSGVIRQRVSPKDKWLQWGSPGGGSQWETVPRTLKGNLCRVGIDFTSFTTLLWTSWQGRITDRSNSGDNRKRKKDLKKIHS